MATFTTLQILREALTKIAGGDARLTQQLELLVALTRFSGVCAAQLEDLDISTESVTYAVQLPVGVHFVDFVLLVEYAGVGTVPVVDASTASLGDGYYMLSFGDGASSVQNPVLRPGAPYISFGPTGTWSVQLRGFVEVKKAGLVGFTVEATAGATVLSGTGLTTTIQRVAQ